MKNVVIAIILTSVFGTFWLMGNYPQGLAYLDKAFSVVQDSLQYAPQNMAAVLMHKPVTVTELRNRYNSPIKEQQKIKVLVVPGHEPNYGGAEYGSLREREMNVELAKYLAEFLDNNEHYEVVVARNNKEWEGDLYSYFVKQWDEIIAFHKDNKEDHYKRINGITPATPQGTPQIKPEKPKVQHNSAPKDVAIRLYGINKWGNENAVDIAIHIHFNDYPRKNQGSPGVYSGFSVYVPESRYDNSPTTKAVAESIFKRLSKYHPVSDLPIEDAGIVEEPDLIAIGAHNTSNAASMLIEYGYIYEPQFQDPEIRSKTLKDMAFQTYLGLQDFFGSGNDVSFAYDTLMLPYTWETNVSSKKGSADDILALQTALLVDGVYPSKGRTKNDCPRSGKIGPCTLNAIEAFQRKYGIVGEPGVVGEKTREALNGRFSVKAL